MALRFVKTVDIAGGSQFLGTEFAPGGAASAVPSKPNRKLIVREILILKGAENAQIRVVKVGLQGGVTQNFDLQATNTGTTTFIALSQLTLSPNDRITDLLPGESIGIISTGAALAMHARIQFEDAPNSSEPGTTDPKVTR